MRAPLVRRAALAAVMTLALGPAVAFDLQVPQPALRVQVPDLPDVALAPQPSPAPDVETYLAGQSGPLKATLALSRAAPEMSARVCAGVFLRGLVRQADMPDRDSIYRAPLNETTFVVLYLKGDEPARVVHAHVLAAVGGTRCAEAHFWRPLGADEDLEAWRQQFMSAVMR